MGSKKQPKRESQFIEEIRAGLETALPGLVRMHRTHEDSGAPDARIEFFEQGRDDQGRIRLGEKKKIYEMFVEFKYSKLHWREVRSLETAWNLLRSNQKVVMAGLALKFPVFLCVCWQGIEASWFRFNVAQIKAVNENKAPPYTVLALAYNSIRGKDGRWTTGQDWGDIDTGPTPPSIHSIAKQHLEEKRRYGKSGLTRPRRY